MLAIAAATVEDSTDVSGVQLVDGDRAFVQRVQRRGLRRARATPARRSSPVALPHLARSGPPGRQRPSTVRLSRHQRALGRSGADGQHQVGRRACRSRSVSAPARWPATATAASRPTPAYGRDRRRPELLDQRGAGSVRHDRRACCPGWRGTAPVWLASGWPSVRIVPPSSVSVPVAGDGQRTARQACRTGAAATGRRTADGAGSGKVADRRDPGGAVRPRSMLPADPAQRAGRQAAAQLGDAPRRSPASACRR